MVQKSDLPKIRAFSVAFAREYKGFMRAENVTQQQLADRIGRNQGYVSERVNGLRPLDTDDVDALASLVDGWTGRDLLIELSKRVRVRGTANNVGGPVDPLDLFDPEFKPKPVDLGLAAKERKPRRKEESGDAS